MATASDSAQELILVVDDDTSQRQLLERWLEREGYAVSLLDCGEALIDALATQMPSAVCLDLHMPGIGGMETLRRLRRTHPFLPVVVLTADDAVDTVVEAVKLGAFNYMVKPVDRTKLVTDLANAVERGRMALRLAQLEREAEGLTVGGIIGESPAVKAMARQIDRLAACDITVLVRGPSGAGKELVAQAIHRASGRREAPFVALNCAAVPENLQESELFGHERGSFTGAERRKIGRLQEADGGTLLLDEVGELDLGLQATLLRALQERSFRRIGGTQEIHSDFRLLTATNKDLEAEVSAGRFREDLFFRIAVFDLEVPPLGQRTGDIPLLAQHFLDKYANQHEDPPPTLAEDTVAVLERYPWPGNVRELENTVQHALVVCSGREIVPADLPPRVLKAVEAAREPGDSEALEMPQEIPAASGAARPPGPGQPPSGLPVLRLSELERLAIEEAISKAEGNLSEACRLLGIGRTTLYRKLKQYEIG